MIQKILIIRFSSLGDIVMTTAMIRCLRQKFPTAQIDMVVREDFLDLIRENPHLNNKYMLSRKGGIKALLDFKNQIQNQYDLIYDAHRSLRSLFLMALVNAKHKVYFSKHYVTRALALTFKLPLLNNKRFLEKFIEPLNPFEVYYDQKGPEVFIPSDLSTKIAEREKIPSQKLIGLIPSAQWPGKRWSDTKFKELAKKLIKNTSHHLLVFGGKEDYFCNSIVESLPQNRIFNLQSKLSILEATSVLKLCDFVIANDTGLMHLADAVAVPSVLIMGPTSGALGCLPFQTKSIVIEENLWCRPCSKNGEAPCIRRKRYCLENISVERVFNASITLLRSLK